MKKVHVSIIIPVRAINRYIIDENLPGCESQTFNEFEVILLPNDTSAKDTVLLKKYPWLTIHPTHKVTRPAQKRDIGAKIARGEILAFIDDDAYPTSDWLKNVVRVYEENKIDALCGPGILPTNASFWERVFDVILLSRIGSGGYDYRFTPGIKRYVDDYPSMNFLIKKNVFDALGGFDNNYWPGEDSKLCEDLVYKKKGKILYDPSVVIYHHRREDLKGFLKQHGSYGYHRGAFFAHGDKNSRRIQYLVPTFFVIYLFFALIYFLSSTLYLLPSTFNPPSSTLYILPFVIYKLLLLYHLINTVLKTKSLKIALFSTIVIFLMHVTYGTKFIHGFFIGLIKKEQIYD